MEKLLDINNLSVSNLSNKLILKDINFGLNRNEFVVLAGVSGSGKTMISLACMGLLPNDIKVDKGNIIFHKYKNAIDVINSDYKTIEDIRGNNLSLVFQDPAASLNPLLKCGEQIVEMFRLKKKLSKKSAISQTKYLLRRVNLGDVNRVFNSYPHQLSGGQNQRVMIAIAISCEPDLLIADEPTTGLDQGVKEEILELLMDIKETNKMSILFITHDISLFMNSSERFIIIQDGSILEDSKDIFNNPKSSYAKSFKKYFHNIKKLSNKQGKNNFNEEKILSINKLSISYLDNQVKSFFSLKNKYHNVLQNVNLDIKKGDTIGIFGNSGSGKTSLVESIVGLNNSYKGNIIYKGIDIKRINNKKKEIQIVFQNPYSSLNPKIKIINSILSVIKLHKVVNSKEIKDLAEYYLKKVGISEEHFFKYPHQLSGGQCQRFCIAMVIAIKPSIIIFDEATSSLDIINTTNTLNIINKIKTDFNLTYIFISHDMDILKFISDKLYYIKDKSLLEYT